MTDLDVDPAMQWSHHLSRLDGARLHTTAETLRRSAASGLPASEEEVRLLVAYALGEISSLDYAAGVMRALGYARSRPAQTTDVAPVAPVAAPEPDAGVAPAPQSSPPAPTPRVTRENVVQAYVAGEIPIGEFLRVARDR